MSETNELQSLEYPVRPLVSIPLADGTDAITDTDISQLAGVYPFDFIPDLNKLDYYSNQNITPHFKLVLSDIDEAGGEVDISEYVTNWGSITRAVDYLSGKMSPSSHSFKLANTKDSGDYLFTLRKNLGNDFWMGKEYNLYIGFMNGVEIDWINLYTGKITRKLEDRIEGSVSVNSHDTIKELNDYKLCSTIIADEIFDIIDTTIVDNRSIQMTIKYGTHELITHSNKDVLKRDSPYSSTECIPNLNECKLPSGYTVADSKTFDPYHAWFIPIQNSINSQSFIGNTTTGFTPTEPYDKNIYYWDYLASPMKWVLVDDINLTNDNIRVMNKVTTDSAENAYKGSFVTIDDIIFSAGANFTDWNDYINNISDDFDPSIIINTQHICVDWITTRDDGTTLSSSNNTDPVSILKDLLISTKFVAFDNLTLDVTPRSTIPIEITPRPTWDTALEYFQSGDIKINVDQQTETSLMNIINDICEITGISFYTTRKFEGIYDADRSIKIFTNTPVLYDNTNKTFSTKDKISKYSVNTDNTLKQSKIISYNFDSNISTKESFDQITTGDSFKPYESESDKVLTLGKSGGNVYLYDSKSFAESINQIMYNSLRYPPEISNISLGKSGFDVEVGQLIDIHDSISNEKITTRVHNVKLDIKSANINIIGKRFQLQYGPDPEYPCKKWLFIDDGKIKDSDCTSIDDPSFYIF